MGDAEFDQLVDILNVTKEGLGRAVLLEVKVVEACHDCMAHGSLGVTDGDKALVAGLLELAVCCDYWDSGG